MIVAGADMDIGRERSALAPHHQRQLGVGLQFDEAVDHLGAGAFEIARPADIGLFVEPRLELDQRGDRLAGFGRFGQRPDDRTSLRGAVERLLDRDHVGIARRLLQELHHDIERFIGVMDDQVLLPDRRKAIAALLADAFGKTRIVWHEFEIGPIDVRQLDELGDRERAIDQEHLVVGDRERALHEAAQIGRHRGLELQPDHRTAPTPLEHAFSNRRTRSSASSSISRSESRITRKAPWPFTL